jgi:hypothetical protein
MTMATDQAEPSHPMRRTDDVPLSGTRSQAMQRLQIGLLGLAAMILLVGLATIIRDRAQQSEDLAVPEAAPTTAVPITVPKVGGDPLADVGVVPDQPSSPTPAPASAGGTGDAPAPTP